MVTAEEIERITAFATLDPEARDRLSRLAADVRLEAGEYAAQETDECALFAVLEGTIEPVKVVDGIERVLGVRNPGDIFGEVPITLGTVFPVGFRAAEDSRVMRLSPRDFHAVAAVAPEVAKQVGRLARHRIAGARGLEGIASEQRPPRAVVFGTPLDASCTELRRFLDRNQITFNLGDTRDAERIGAVGRPAARAGRSPTDKGRRWQDGRPAATASGGRTSRARHRTFRA